MWCLKAMPTSLLQADFGFWPHGARIIDQLGLWEKVQELSMPMRTSQNRSSSGELISETRLFEEMNIR